VIGYHGASATWKHTLSIPPDEMERQVRALLRLGFRPVSTSIAVARPRERFICVTFDDAYRSVANILPALDRLGVPATIFACSRFADAAAPLAVPELATQPETELLTMGWDELREHAARGVEIGSHTVSHPHLPRLSDEEIERELRESRERIEAELGRRCRILAYPYGEEDARCRAAARAAGYEAAFTLPRFGDPLEDDLYALPRVGLFRGNGVSGAVRKSAPLVRRAAGVVRRLARVRSAQQRLA
jgi:peptidoglycan/xylan/chitin deacetylase (PgdA/CDA1 family)